jgi:hypothetical protein
LIGSSVKKILKHLTYTKYNHGVTSLLPTFVTFELWAFYETNCGGIGCMLHHEAKRREKSCVVVCMMKQKRRKRLCHHLLVE